MELKPTFDNMRVRVARELARVYRGDPDQWGREELQAAIYAIGAVVEGLCGFDIRGITGEDLERIRRGA